MNRYNTKVIDTIKGVRLTKTTVKIWRKDKKWIMPEQLEELYDALVEKANKEGKRYEIMVKGLSPISWFTLKGFKDEGLNLQTVEQYINGRVVEPEDQKFGKFAQLQIAVMKHN